MKYLLIIFFLYVFLNFCFAQEIIYGSITHDQIQRDYILYVPDNYTGNTPVPLILNFHGIGRSANHQMQYCDFRTIADSAGFLIVHPQGTLFNGMTHWNIGGFTVGSNTDDLGFTEALIDSLSAEYNVDPTMVYSAGYSNGGGMSFLLACQLSERIAAIASVSATMTPEIYNNSNPQHPTPILQMHGTVDNVWPYNGTPWAESVDDVIQYWVGYNNCNPTPSITVLPDIDPNDGSTVELFVYDDGDNNVSVLHYKIIGGGHTWPGNTGGGTNRDIDASEEIWNFFSRFDINGLIIPVEIENPIEIERIGFELSGNYPNPFNPETTIYYSLKENLQVTLNVYNIKGQLMKTLVNDIKPVGDHSVIWNGRDDKGKLVSGGIYFYKIKAGNGERIRKMILVK